MVRHTLLLSLTIVMFSGCGRQAAPRPADDKPIAQIEQGDPKPQPNGGQPGADPKKPDPAAVDPNKLPAPAFFSADEKQEKYETALNDALEMLAQRKLPEALVAMEAARGFDDNDFIRGEIAKVKQRLDQDSAAKTTVQNIESVLGEGKAAEAAKLSAQALKEFGGSNDARDLVKLGLQADALATVQKGEGEAARFDRLRGEGQAALAEKNLRAAALAFEQALAAREDAALQQKLDGIRVNLEKYDALRAKAAELRKDPAQIEDALAALQAAKDAWDTLQVRQDLDEYTLALQKRRDTLSVADFDLRADLGMPEMGRSVAEELLPLFKTRFDLVERSQLSKVLGELKLEQALDDPAQQREVGKLAKVRFLVLGSVYPLAGVTVQARLVDVKTGLVVQTAKVVAPTAQDVFALLPELARQLTMNDDDKMAYDAAQQQKFARAPAVIEADAVPPPPPPLPAVAAPVVAAEVVQAVPPPAFGGLRIEVFRALPPPPAVGIEIAPAGIFGGRLRHRLLVAALQRGDFFVQIGNLGEAQRQFEFALNLAPGNADVLLRLDRIRPFLAPQVVLVAQPVFVPRPRVAVLNFLVAGDPRVVPPALGVFTPPQLAPYFSNRFEVVDPGLVYWYMGSLGLTMNDLLTDPDARRWLGRAVGVRYFLLGTIEQTGSFDVTTYLMDAEFGFLQGSGRIHVRNAFELRLRLGELAQLTLMTPDERQAFLAQAQVQAYDALIFRGRVAMQEQSYVAAVQNFNEALQIRPGAFDALFFLAEADRLARVQALQQRRVQFLIGPQFAVIEVQRRQWDVARACDQQRLLALQQTAAFGEPERVLLLQQREQAQTALIRQAQLSFKTRNFSFSVSVFESAMNIAPAPAIAVVPVPGGDPWRELALARLEAGKQAQLVQAQLAQQQEAALRQQREQELAAARTQLAAQQKLLDTERQARILRDKQAYTKAMAEGQHLLSKGNFEEASGAFLVAQRLNRTPLVDNLLEETNQRRAIAQGKTDAERQLLETRLQAEREKRKAAETDAKRNQELYLQAIQVAQAALTKKDYATAQTKFEAADAVFKTDVVLTGLKQVAQARAQNDAALNAKQNADANAARVKTMIADGQTALKAKQYADAVKTFQQAKQIAPDHIDVLAGLTAAEHGRDLLLAQERKQADAANRLASFQRLLKSGQANLAAKQYDAAVANLSEAIKLSPGDATAVAALKQAEQARAGTAPDPTAQKNLAAYQKLISDGRFALGGKRYDDAIKAFSEAQKLLPSDQAAKDLLGDAQKGKKDAADALVAVAQKQKRQADFQAALLAGQKAYAAKDYAAAVGAYTQAAQLMPDDTKAPLLLKQAQQALNDAGVGDADVAKRQAQYAAALKAGQGALANKKFDDAIKAFSDARKILPDDPQVLKLLKQALQAQDDSRTQEADLLKQKLEQQKKTQFAALIKEAEGKLNGKQFAEAKSLYQQALKLYANDQSAARGIREADQALADLNKTPPKDNKALYTKAMQDGAAQEKQGKHADAVKSYEAALQLIPKDAAATTGVRRAQFGLHMAEGQRFLDGNRFADAQREFDAALKISPTDPTAKKLLDKAKKMMK